MGKKTRRLHVRFPVDLHDWLLKFSIAVGKDPSEIVRTAVDLMRLYYLGESVTSGKGLAAIQHLLESLAARAEILSHTPLKEKKE